MKNNSNLFFTCSLIEYIGRERKLNRRDIVRLPGDSALERIYKYADILHCEPIKQVADNYVNMLNIPLGDFDNVVACQYTVPDFWDIGEVYARLIEDVHNVDVISTLKHVYSSWINDAISNYNSDFYYQSREYIALCYKEKTVV